jgi:hypothetical protein
VLFSYHEYAVCYIGTYRYQPFPVSGFVSHGEPSHGDGFFYYY